jgi:rRNA maturation endonuclease Nob1
MILERLRGILGRDDDDERYRCINCGEEYTRSHAECPECGGPFLAPIDDENQNA